MLKSAKTPTNFTLRQDQLVIQSDFPLPASHRLVKELTDRRQDICQALDLPTSDEPIHVYLFQDAERFGDFVRRQYPKFPTRRAFFLETDTKLLVFAHWNDRIGEDLRHEITHGYIHSIVCDLPLWLDEGLAEYFETPRGLRGLNVSSVKLLLAHYGEGTWRPDLAKLEKLTSGEEMTALDYAEAWLWVHFLLHQGGDESPLIEYIATWRREGSCGPLHAMLTKRGHASPESDILAHLSLLGSRLGNEDE